MAFLPTAFDARTVAPAVEIGALPSGEYLVAITDSSFESTKMGDGQFLKLVFTVLDGEHKGRQIWDRLNLVNRNPTAVEIAQRALSAICHATGVLTVADSSQLHDRPLVIKVKYVPPAGDFGEKNEVKAYKSAAVGSPAPSRQPAPPPAPPVHPKEKETVPPWKRANHGSAGLAAQPKTKQAAVEDDISF